MTNTNFLDGDVIALEYGKKNHLATIGIPFGDGGDHHDIRWLTESMVAGYIISNEEVRTNIANVADTEWGEFENENEFFYCFIVNAIACEWIFNIESMKGASRLTYMYLISEDIETSSHNPK